jgi:hypothetical protein
MRAERSARGITDVRVGESAGKHVTLPAKNTKRD